MTSHERVTGTKPAQLGRLQDLARRMWSWSSRWHPGELSWFWWEHGGPQPPWRVATWQAAGRTDAWAWSRHPGRLDLQVDPGRLDLLPDVLDWFDHVAGAAPRSITVLDSETALRDALEQGGYVPVLDGPFFAHLRTDLSCLPEPAPLPAGFTLRAVRGEEDAELRAVAHRAAFADGEHGPDALAYRSVMTSGTYRAALDWIVEAADGTPAAFCLSWLDETSDVAVLEPVGTVPQYRRQGLARAVVGASLRAAVESGARHARVCARGDDEYVAARATYESLGFRRYAHNVRLVRSA